MDLPTALNKPNDRFFEKYGLLDDPESQLAKSEFLFLRHGTSKFNELSK